MEDVENIYTGLGLLSIISTMEDGMIMVFIQMFLIVVASQQRHSGTPHPLVGQELHHYVIGAASPLRSADGQHRSLCIVPPLWPHGTSLVALPVDYDDIHT